jgi:hypothetical protein
VLSAVNSVVFIQTHTALKLLCIKYSQQPTLNALLGSSAVKIEVNKHVLMVLPSGVNWQELRIGTGKVVQQIKQNKPAVVRSAREKRRGI